MMPRPPAKRKTKTGIADWVARTTEQQDMFSLPAQPIFPRLPVRLADNMLHQELVAAAGEGKDWQRRFSIKHAMHVLLF